MIPVDFTRLRDCHATLAMTSRLNKTNDSRELVLIHDFKRLDFSPKKDRRFACPFFGAEDEI